jgi:hypothetical protein
MDVTPEVFLAAKEQISLDSPEAKKLADKMKDIVERYKCFVEEEILQIKQAAPPRSRNHHHTSHNNHYPSRCVHHHPAHSLAPRTKILATGTHGAVVGLLNKITASNYERIKTKILRYFSFQDSLELVTILKLILKKTFTHVVYRKIYEGLIHEFYKSYPQDVLEVVEQFIVDFVRALSVNLSTFIVDYDPQIKYDEYCVQTKAKDQVIAQFQIVVLFDHVFLNAKYNLQIMDAINDVLFTYSDNFNIAGICTEFIKLLLTQYGIPEKDTIVHENIFHISENLIDRTDLPKRLQFAWEDILGSLRAASA